jgi:hypothetical protein
MLSRVLSAILNCEEKLFEHRNILRNLIKEKEHIKKMEESSYRNEK